MFDMLSLAMEALWATLVTHWFPAAIILGLGILLIRFGLKLVAKILERSPMEPIAYNLILKVLQVAAYILLGLIVASKLGLDVTGVVAMASVLTLAVSLSVQDLLTNLISGFTLLYTKPFNAGDYVEIGGQAGTVREIGLTYTKLATPDNKMVSIPNGAVTSAQVVNYSVLGTRRVDVLVNVSYGYTPARIIGALKKAAQLPTVLGDPAPFAAVRNYKDSTLEYVLQVWSTADDYWPTLFALNENVRNVFEAEGIAFSFPHLNVHLDK